LVKVPALGGVALVALGSFMTWAGVDAGFIEVPVEGAHHRRGTDSRKTDCPSPPCSLY